MISCSNRFCLFLTGVAVLLLAGCASSRDPNDRLSTQLRVHLEAQPNQMVPPKAIAVYRENPQVLSVESLYLLTEDNVVSAKVVDQMGTFAIQITFDRWAIPLLDHNSSSWQGRRLAIQAQWGGKQKESRWLAAPRLTQHITDGTITFTPDATLEEAHEIVIGLNNNARKTRKQLEW